MDEPKKIIVEVDASTGERVEREATDEEMANWPVGFAGNPPEEP